LLATLAGIAGTRVALLEVGRNLEVRQCVTS
jgi:hypothetical protein